MWIKMNKNTYRQMAEHTIQRNIWQAVMLTTSALISSSEAWRSAGQWMRTYKTLDVLHWESESNRFLDYGLIIEVGHREKSSHISMWLTDSPCLVWGNLWYCEFKQDMLYSLSSSEEDTCQEHSFHHPDADEMQTDRYFWAWAVHHMWNADRVPWKCLRD